MIERERSLDRSLRLEMGDGGNIEMGVEREYIGSEVTISNNQIDMHREVINRKGEARTRSGGR